METYNLSDTQDDVKDIAFEYVWQKIEEDVRSEKERIRIDLEGTAFDSLSEKEKLSINEQIEQMQNALNGELDTSMLHVN